MIAVFGLHRVPQLFPSVKLWKEISSVPFVNSWLVTAPGFPLAGEAGLDLASGGGGQSQQIKNLQFFKFFVHLF